MTQELSITKDSNDSKLDTDSEDNFAKKEIISSEISNISDINLETEVLYYIEQKFPDYYHKNITRPKKAKLEHLSNLFNEFKDIGRDKEKHNLKWAFKKANRDFNFEELQKVQPKTDCFIAYDDVVCAVHKQSKAKINNFSRRFSLLSLGVSLLDIVVSVFLILIVTILSHVGDHIFDTVLFSILFITLIALTKVSLDRFAIMPVIDMYGWLLFNRTIAYARDEAIKLNAVYLVLLESINRKEEVGTRFDLINKQKRELLKSRRILSLPGLVFPKPSDN